MSTFNERSSTETGLREVATEFIKSLLRHPGGHVGCGGLDKYDFRAIPESTEEQKHLQKRRADAGTALLRLAYLPVEGVAFTPNYGEQRTGPLNNPSKSYPLINGISGLTGWYLEDLAIQISRVLPLNSTLETETPQTLLEQAIVIVEDWVCAMKPMEDIRLNEWGDLLYNRSTKPPLPGKLPRRVVRTDTVKPEPWDHLSHHPNNVIGWHVGCDGSIVLRTTSAEDQSRLFCVGCGMSVILKGPISCYQDIANLTA